MAATERDALSGPARMAALLTAATFVLLVVGASVRVNGAGLACPDWPLCFGMVIPPIDYGVAFEFGHRVFAGLIGLGYAALLVWMVRLRALVGMPLVWAAVVGAFVLALQIVLGGLTVLELLAQWTVASHLITGNTFCVVLLLLAIGLRERIKPVSRSAISPAVRVVAVAMAVAIPAQVVLGGYVSASYAGLACGTWPTCDGTNWFPTWSGLVGLQLAHRVVAYTLMVLAIGGVALTRGSGRPARVAWGLLGLVMLQAAIGVANVLLTLRWEVTLAHTAGAAALMLGVALLNWEAWRAPVWSTAEVRRPAPGAVGAL